MQKRSIGKRKRQCYICKKNLLVNMSEEYCCIDGSTWFEWLDVIEPGRTYAVVEGISCIGVPVCIRCKSKIPSLKRERQVYPWTDITIDGKEVSHAPDSD